MIANRKWKGKPNSCVEEPVSKMFYIHGTWVVFWAIVIRNVDIVAIAMSVCRLNLNVCVTLLCSVNLSEAVRCVKTVMDIETWEGTYSTNGGHLNVAKDGSTARTWPWSDVNWTCKLKVKRGQITAPWKTQKRFEIGKSYNERLNRNRVCAFQLHHIDVEIGVETACELRRASSYHLGLILRFSRHLLYHSSGMIANPDSSQIRCYCIENEQFVSV